MHEGCPNGSIEVICGSMFSGKSEELIRRVKRASIARQKVQVFKHTLDDRFHKMEIASHSGFSFEAFAVKDISQIEELLEDDTKVIAIDEAQFYNDNLTSLCQKLADQGKRVIVAGLDQDFRGRPFEITARLMAVSEFVTKQLAICMVCGNPANRSFRLSKSKKRIQVGAADRYEARCRNCFKKR